MYGLSSNTASEKASPSVRGNLCDLCQFKENSNISVCLVDYYEFTRIIVDHLRVSALQSMLAIALT